MSLRGMLQKLLVVAVLYAVSMPTPHLAADTVPNTINYQGTLTDGAGQPINGTKNIVFSLYSVPSGGAAFWTSGAKSVAVTNGSFSVTLGDSPVLNPANLTGTTYIGVEVESDPEMAPRQAFSSVPYALKAGNAGIPDGSVTTAKIADGSITVAKLAAGVFYVPEGFLINGKIVPSVASNHLTVAIKGMDGNDPSATNPVYCRIGGVVRSITSVLTWTVSAGGNYLNLGSAELATKEVDLFVYLGWDTTDFEVNVIASRIPYANTMGDFTFTDTGEKGQISTMHNNATDVVVNVGRFAATLSAGPGFTWSIPTYTAANLVQRPIYETRWLAQNNNNIIYRIQSNTVEIAGWFYRLGSTSVGGVLSLSNASTGFTFSSVPFNVAANYAGGKGGTPSNYGDQQMDAHIATADVLQVTTTRFSVQLKPFGGASFTPTANYIGGFVIKGLW